MTEEIIERQIFQMTVPPFKRGELIGAGVNSVDLLGEDGRVYTVIPTGIVELQMKRLKRRLLRRRRKINDRCDD